MTRWQIVLIALIVAVAPSGIAAGRQVETRARGRRRGRHQAAGQDAACRIQRHVAEIILLLLEVAVPLRDGRNEIVGERRRRRRLRDRGARPQQRCGGGDDPEVLQDRSPIFQASMLSSACLRASGAAMASATRRAASSTLIVPTTLIVARNTAPVASCISPTVRPSSAATASSAARVRNPTRSRGTGSFFIFLFIWLRGSLPRLRYDHGADLLPQQRVGHADHGARGQRLDVVAGPGAGGGAGRRLGRCVLVVAGGQGALEGVDGLALVHGVDGGYRLDAKLRGQILLGAGDVCAGAGVLYVLLPVMSWAVLWCGKLAASFSKFRAFSKETAPQRFRRPKFVIRVRCLCGASRQPSMNLAATG